MGNSRGLYVADHMIDARPQTGTVPDEQTAMRYPTRASELDHRRLQVPSPPLHEPLPNQLHAGEREERPSRDRFEPARPLSQLPAVVGPDSAPETRRGVPLFSMPIVFIEAS
jgi:hypothetical protein